MANGAGSGGAAVHIEFRFMAPIGAYPNREHASIIARSGLLLAIEDHRARAIAEQHAGAAVGPIENPRESLGSDHQSARERAGPKQRVRRCQAINKTRTHRLQVERGAVSDAKPGLNRNGACRERIIGRGGGEYDQIDRLGIDASMRKRHLRRAYRHMRGIFARRRNSAFVDTGALNDPVIGGVDLAGEFLVGEDLIGQIAAAAKHHRAKHGHEAAPPSMWPTGCDLTCRASAVRIRAKSSSRTTPWPSSIAAAKPSASVPP